MSNAKKYEGEFIEHVKGLIDYWLTVEGKSEREKMQGVIFSTLVAIDGEDASIGPYILKPVIDDKGAEGPDIGGDLHNVFYNRKPARAKPAKLPGRIIIAIDDAGVHIRRTIFVEHNETKELAIYNAKPMFSIHDHEVKRQILEIVRKNYKQKKAAAKHNKGAKKRSEIID